MGGFQDQQKSISARWAATCAAVALHASCALGAQAAGPKAPTIESVRSEINALEKDLLASRENQASAATQLRKIRKLMGLQQKEIALSRKKVSELGVSLGDLSKQRHLLQESIEKQKVSLRAKLRELERLNESAPLDARWLADLEAQNQKSYFLAKTLKRELASVARLRQDAMQAQNLELKIIEEKNKLDYYVQELQSQISMLSANEDVQKELIRTNRSNRLDAIARMRSLKDSEHELEKMLGSLRDGERVEASLIALKGKLPFPVEGQVVGVFGKSYNPKTNLLTFQKGITLGARPAAEVRSVASGKVVFAGPLKNYGLITIVEHPGQYYTLYGQMGSVAVQPGTGVRQGDVVGKTAGEPFYFEIRNKNVAVNPMQWLGTNAVALNKH